MINGLQNLLRMVMIYEHLKCQFDLQELAVSILAAIRIRLLIQLKRKKYNTKINVSTVMLFKLFQAEDHKCSE